MGAFAIFNARPTGDGLRLHERLRLKERPPGRGRGGNADVFSG
jgi:hypothetical protein